MSGTEGERFAGLHDKYATEAATPTVRDFHAAIRGRFEQRFQESGLPWEEFVFNPEHTLTLEDLTAVEAEMLAGGYRFDHSAQVSVTEEPEKYKAGAAAPAAEASTEPVETVAAGEQLVVGHGDNVFATDANIEGVAREISTLERVMEMLSEGVPEDTIAIIDDCGGTMTAPIIADFKGILCLAGTVRTHLAILSREYGIPCLMATELDGLREGDAVRIETTKKPRDITPEGMAAAATSSGEQRATVWRIA
ncbi:MAG TPA: PEP-utilizing enzyme [Solirubrobacterales bacterium]|nr:PEP-utilizing enzyme [Solirubrobacterales bacterium]